MARLSEAFDRTSGLWDAFYRDPTGRSLEYTQRQRKAIALLVARVPAGGRVLEIGAGAGHASVELLERGYGVVIADVSLGMLEMARSNIARVRDGVRFIHAAAAELPHDTGPVAAVLALGVLDYVADIAPTIDRIADVLGEGGVAVLTFSNRASLAEQVEAPLKRAAARILLNVTCSDSVGRVAALADTAHPRTESEVRAALARRFDVEDASLVGFGVRVGATWLPPSRIVRRLDEAAPDALRFLARTIVVVARKRPR